jgi:4-amino-4-deoxy-L-arabinose transferase-like glycosyltransferase
MQVKAVRGICHHFIKNRNQLSLLVLGSLLAIVIFVRFLCLDIVPTLNWDEASYAYNAISIMHTGHDEWGEFLPLQRCVF